jgi:hypothetical protein
VTDSENTSSGSVPVLVIHSARPLIVFQADQSHRSTRNELGARSDSVVEVVVLSAVVDVVTFVDTVELSTVEFAEVVAAVFGVVVSEVVIAVDVVTTVVVE